MTPRKGILTNGTTELRAWRYAVPGNPATLECWARLTIVQTGPLRAEMMVVSDRGCYAASVKFGIESCPRMHLAALGPDRAAQLLLGDWPKVFDGASTIAAAKASVISARRYSEITKDAARLAWESITTDSFQSEYAFCHWCVEMDGIMLSASDLLELARYDYPGDLKRFIFHDWPRLQAAIRWDLFCEMWVDIGRAMFRDPDLIGQVVKPLGGLFSAENIAVFRILSVSHNGNRPLYRLQAFLNGRKTATWENCAPELFEVVLP